VDNAVGAELYRSVLFTKQNWWKTHDVNGDNATVEIDGQSLETNVGAQSLGSNAQSLGNFEQCRHSVCNEDLACWVEVGGDMVKENLLELLL